MEIHVVFVFKAESSPIDLVQLKSYFLLYFVCCSSKLFAFQIYYYIESM